MPRSIFRYGDHLTDGRRYGVLVEGGEGLPVVLWHDGGIDDFKTDDKRFKRTTAALYARAVRLRTDGVPVGFECERCRRYLDRVRGMTECAGCSAPA